jgi:hypothetical protein
MTGMYGNTFENISGLGSKLMAEMLRTGQRPGGRRAPAINPSVEVAPNAPLPMAPNSRVVTGAEGPPPGGAQPPSNAPAPMGLVEEMYSKYGSQAAGQADPYAGQRAEIYSRMLREFDKPDAPRERIDYPQTVSPEMMQEHVRQLRGQQTLGNLFQMSGDRALGAAGEQLSRADPMGYMQDYGKHDTTRRYQEWQANYEPKETKYDRISALGQMERALPNALGAGAGGDYQNVHAASMKDMGQAAKRLSSARNLRSTFDNQFTQVFGEYQSVFANVPTKLVELGLDKMTDNLANAGRGDLAERMRSASQWWSQYKTQYELPLLKEQFGAALTAVEAARWDAAMAMGPSSSPEQIRAQLATIEELSRKMVEYAARQYSPVYGADKVMPLFEHVLGEDNAPQGAPQSGGNSYKGISYEVLP